MGSMGGFQGRYFMRDSLQSLQHIFNLLIFNCCALGEPFIIPVRGMTQTLESNSGEKKKKSKPPAKISVV